MQGKRCIMLIERTPVRDDSKKKRENASCGGKRGAGFVRRGL